MHALEFSEYANIGIADPEDVEFKIEMEYGSRKSSYTISKRVDYIVYESEPQMFYAKCKTYGCECDWFIQASLIQKKICWEIQRCNRRHTCSMKTISQNHSKGFKVLYLQKLVVNIGYSRMVEEYNVNYKSRAPI
ncbi:hypothetical protein Ahy_A04g020230 [Arachis hypogaea]|uniref:Uncharacterized protein n=1 Tax=Arachis hypogaea TaxID=3818 RepID=A0A445DH62_ARAHY|nr:hypothetical protein Ahy_A04g020230 [Arachis hypogaea]